MARNSVPSASPALATDHEQRRSLPVSLIVSVRPHQWTKNLFVFAGLIFGERLFDPAAATAAGIAFIAFCALSSAVYLLNDIRDRDADRLHPVKRRRPIAAGDLSVPLAALMALILAGSGAVLAFGLSRNFGIVAMTYLALNLLYSSLFKHVVILDVLVLSMGFVMRAWGGAVAVEVAFSHWLLLLVLLLALFLALSKRRAELVALADDAKAHRPSLAEYSPYLLDQMIGVVTASTLIAYAFYTIDPETVAKFRTDHLLWTVPFPLYGIFRYLYLVHQREGGGNPSEMLLTDKPLLACVALWGAFVIAIVYGPLR